MKSERPDAKPRRYTQGARAEAAEATGKRILDAFLTRLMETWFDEITLDHVAEAAEVTVQTVVRRFGGKEGLLAEAVKILAAQINARRESPPGDVDRLIDGLVDDYEQTGDAVIRLLALEPRQPVLQPVLALGRGEHRNWASGAFADVLAPLSEPTRGRVLDAIVVVTDVYTWKLLRRDMARSASETAATMKGLVRSTLAGIPHFDPSGDRR